MALVREEEEEEETLTAEAAAMAMAVSHPVGEVATQGALIRFLRLLGQS